MNRGSDTIDTFFHLLLAFAAIVVFVVGVYVLLNWL